MRRARAEQTKIQEQLAGEKAEREAIAIAEKKKREERDFIAARKEQEFRVQRLRASPIPKNRLRAEIEAQELEKTKTFKEKRAAKLAANKRKAITKGKGVAKRQASTKKRVAPKRKSVTATATTKKSPATTSAKKTKTKKEYGASKAIASPKTRKPPSMANKKRTSGVPT